MVGKPPIAQEPSEAVQRAGATAQPPPIPGIAWLLNVTKLRYADCKPQSLHSAGAVSTGRPSVARTQTKTATLTLRVPPEVKELLAAAAKADRRSLANMLEVIVVEYCDRNGIHLGPGPKTSGAA